MFAFVTFARETSAKIDLKEMRESQVICIREGVETLGEEEERGGKGVCQQQRQRRGAGPGWLEI